MIEENGNKQSMSKKYLYYALLVKKKIAQFEFLF